MLAGDLREDKTEAVCLRTEAERCGLRSRGSSRFLFVARIPAGGGKRDGLPLRAAASQCPVSATAYQAERDHEYQRAGTRRGSNRRNGPVRRRRAEEHTPE